MPVMSLHETVDGTRVELPSFGYWVKVGMAFSIGAMLVGAIGTALFLAVLLPMITGPARFLPH